MKKKIHDIYFIDVFRILWSKKKQISLWTGIAVVLGVLIALGTPSEYTSTVKMAPEGLRNNTGGISDLAAMAGLDVGMTSRSDAISPVVYPDVISSTPFLVRLSKTEVVFNTQKKTLYAYILEDIENPFPKKIISSPFLLLNWIRTLLSSSNEDAEASIDTLNAYQLTKVQEMVLVRLQRRIFVDVDKKKRILTATVTMQDPLICAVVADSMVRFLNEYITQYRTQKAKQDFEFTQGLLEEAKKEYYQAQAKYAYNSDANNNVIKSSVAIERDRLFNEQQLAFSVYSNLAQQLEMAKIRVQEQTPSISILEPPRVPVFKSNLSRAGIVFFALFLGFILSIFAILVINHRAIYRTSTQTE